VGYDISDAACEIANARQLDSCRFEAVDMAQWPGAKDLSMIIAEECLYYLAAPDLRNFMRRCMDSLTADGTMLVVVHDRLKHAQTLNICRQSAHATEWAVGERGYILLAKNQAVPLSTALGNEMGNQDAGMTATT
jgi:trans-aconitate methyltransferase